MVLYSYSNCHQQIICKCIRKTEIDLINATLESYVSDGIYPKLENSTIYPLTSTMHMLQKWCYGVHV